MAKTTYPTENLIAGLIQTQQVPFAADTYYRGMPLEYNSGTGRYEYLSSGSLAGIFLGDETTLANDDYDSIIQGGEVYEDGIVDDSGDALTITEANIAAWANLGFYVKKA